MKQIALSDLDQMFAAIAKEETVYLPVAQEDGASAFEPWSEGRHYNPVLNTVRSAKDFFFPQVEDMMAFRLQDQNIDIMDTRKSCEDYVIFGVRACDVRSFDILDNVYLSDPVDTYYKNRRDHGTVVSIACSRPAETCFCGTFGIDASNAGGDVQGWIAEEKLWMEPLTEKGEAFLEKIDELTSEADPAPAETEKEKIRTILDQLPLKDVKVPEKMRSDSLGVFSDPKWAELSEACMGCGTCTFVCPTCQCFDIRDFNTGHGVERYRCWDSCMYSEFTQEAAGNPRTTQLQRFRQRFMHKLSYYPDKYDGVYSCVGCGRCLKKCPQSLNLVKVMNAFGGEE
ncbi:MAG: 4Fe-4S dicluster domain-containing protein [Acutalibacteraceae bacterium]